MVGSVIDGGRGVVEGATLEGAVKVPTVGAGAIALVSDECKTHLCFELISHAILCILYPY